MDYSVASVDETKAHIVLKEGQRVDENDESFQIISKACVFVKEDNKWKMKFTSVCYKAA